MLRLRGGCGGISPDTAKDRNENQEIEHIYVEDSEEEGSVEDLVVEETPEDVEIEHINVVDSAKEESPKLNTMDTGVEDLVVEETPEDVVTRESPKGIIVD